MWRPIRYHRRVHGARIELADNNPFSRKIAKGGYFYVSFICAGIK